MLRPTLRPWGTVALLWGVALFNYLDRLAIASMRDPIREAIPMSDARFGLLTSVFLWTYGLLSPGGGYLADRFGRSRVIVGSLLVWSAVLWLTGQAHTYSEMLWARALMGVSEACYLPAALALIADHHRGPTRSFATGLHMTGIYAGAALGGLGGYIADLWGWRAGFTLFGAAGVTYAGILALCLRDAPAPPSASSGLPPPQAIRFGTALRALASSPAFRLLLAMATLVGIANWCVNGWLPTYLRDRFHLSLGAAGLSATGYVQAASFFGVLLGGLAADRWSRRDPAGRSRVPAIGLGIAAPFLFLACSTASLPWAIGGLAAYGIARGCLDANLMPLVRQAVDERFSATAYGVLNLAGCVAGGAMIYAGGRFQDAGIGLRPAFCLSALGLLATGLLLLALGRSNLLAERHPSLRQRKQPSP